MSCGRDEAVCGSRRRRCGREGMDRGGWDEEWVGVGFAFLFLSFFLRFRFSSESGGRAEPSGRARAYSQPKISIHLDQSEEG